MRADVFADGVATRIEGPLLFLRRTVNVGLNEAVEVIGSDGQPRLGRIAALDEEMLTVEVLESTAGLDLEGTRVRVIARANQEIQSLRAHIAELQQREAISMALSDDQPPLAVIGLDVLTDGSKCVLQAFLEHFEIPFVTTYKAKGILPEDHRLCLGGAGLSPLADSHLLPLVQAAVNSMRSQGTKLK